MRKVVFLGCGAVAKVVISELESFLNIDWNNVYIIDIADVRKHPALAGCFNKGANFLKMRVLEDEYEDLFKVLKL